MWLVSPGSLKELLRIAGARFFYRLDALSVIQPTLSKHALRNIINQPVA